MKKRGTRNIKLVLEYDGTHFFGLQTQKGRRTIQSELESALRKLFRTKVSITASGRTDSGVHAQAQIANFKVDSNLSLVNIRRGLNFHLPEDLAVVKVTEAPDAFHSQFAAKRKIYEYRVLNRPSRSPLERLRSFHVPYRLNLPRMRRAARLLCGTHDFRAFESSGGRRQNAVRTIRRFQITKQGDFVCFTVEANGFLYKMVRNMVGALLDVGRGRLPFGDLKRVVNSDSQTRVGFAVPPQGLVLKGVTYGRG